MKRANTWLARYRAMDWTVLYLRLFLGGIMLLHNIGKLQTYNEIVDSYPELPPLSSAATFTVITLCEVILSVMLVIGFKVRLSSSLLAAGMFVAILTSFHTQGFQATELRFVYMGSYLALVISGAGMFSLDFALTATREANMPK